MDEFDHVLMEALNESVPPAMFTTNLAERLVKRRRRSHLWRLLFALGLVSAATAAMTVAMVFSDDTDARQGTADGFRGSDTPVASSFDEIKANLDYSSSLAISTSQQGATQVQNTTIKKAAALMGEFKTTDRLKAAAPEEIAAVIKVNAETAAKVCQYIRDNL